ncbi:hypothetical protein LTR62_008191 [Meristemomyces frigidus]|uniref:Alpha-galactosidase n=1 Tax=Meristemomyces frigidus TaxID=1508187 RepID=A0AAN7TAY6_9PEZI|nr:hypothetical protein LTR62_008191 [Meristemomyces frigidus]
MAVSRSLRRNNTITYVLAGGLCLFFLYFFFGDTTSIPQLPTYAAPKHILKSKDAAPNELSPPSLPFRKPAKLAEGERPAPPPVVHYHMNNVTITSDPIGNRESILILTPLARFYDEYWDNLVKLSFPHDLISLGFIIPKGKDGNLATQQLQARIEKTQAPTNKNRFASITILRQDEEQTIAQDEKDRHALSAQKERRAAMSRARNALLFTTLGPTTSWVLWLDSDIVETPPSLIQDLASHDKPLIVPNCFQRYHNKDKDAMDVRPYDFNSWIDSATAKGLAEKMGPEEIILEGYAEMATYRSLMAYMADPNGDSRTEVDLDGVGGTALLVKAHVHRDGAMFPPFPFYHLIETEGFARMAARLGWKATGLPNYYNAYGCDIDETKILQAANAMVSLGFQKAGYNYVNSDDCWSQRSGRDATTHQLLPNFTKFPEGISGTASKVHNLGFKFGIYSSAGLKTCGGYPASLGYEAIDASTFASWGVDYLKADPSFSPTGIVNGSCTPSTPPVNHYSFVKPIPICPPYKWPVDGNNYTAKYTALRFRIMEEALLAQNRTMLYSLCEWGVDEPWTWGNQTGSSWRMSNDINPSWSRILQILNQNSFLTNYGNFYGHNDADMLEVGNGNLTAAEARSHFALWAMMKSPLLIGTDVTKLSAHDIGVLQNKPLLAFNQDSHYGASAAPYKWGTNEDWTFNSTFPAQYWSGASSNGTMVAMFNPYNETMVMTAEYSEIPQLEANGCYEVTEIWNGTSYGCKEKSLEVSVGAHDTAVLLFGQSC